MMNNEAKSQRKTKSEYSERCVELRAEQKAATGAKGEQKRGQRPERPVAAKDGSSEALESAKAAETSHAAESFHVV
jgi:hypothetical protein